MTALIELIGLSKRYRAGDETVVALDDVSLTIKPNEYVAVVGSSGSGKSTLMNIIGCLDLPTTGQYLLNGRDVSELPDQELARTRNREIGFVFQNFNLLPRVSALQNVMHPLIYAKVGRREREAAARAALERVGLSGRAGHLPSQLSGGQRQRVAIARALSTEPSLIIADEPTGNLDSTSGAAIISLFDKLHRDGQTVLLVTHNEEISLHCRRRITLCDGRIVNDRAGPTRHG
jgi:putative ABC transport system ATP-binding protein